MNPAKAIFLILSIGLIIYANSFGNQFVWDDEFLVLENDYIRNWRSLPQIFTSELRCFSPDLSNYYRPLQTISYAIDYAFWRLEPFGYHLTNLLLHMLCAYLVYLVVQFFYESRAALLSSLLFLVHPLGTQVVTYISGRAESLVTLFFLGSFYLFMKSFSENKRNLPLYFFSIFFYLLALLSKEISLIFPLAFLLYYLVFKARAKSLSFPYCLPYFILSLTYLLLRITFLDFTKGAKTLFLWQDTPFLIRLFGFGRVILGYLGILIFPVNLRMEYVSVYPESLFSLKMLLSVFVVVLILALFILSWRFSKVTFFFMSWFFVLLFPAANIVIPLGVSISAHWIYLPAIGAFCIFSAGLVRVASTEKKAVKILGSSLIGGILIFYAALTFSHNYKWHDKIRLYLYELKFSPGNCILHNNLGNEYRKKRFYLEAEQEYQKSIAANPKYALAYNNLGLVYRAQGLTEKAINSFLQAAHLRPDLPQIYLNLGLAYQIKGEPESAEAYFRHAANIAPKYAPSYHHLGVLYAELDKKELAKSYYRRAIEANPLYIPAYYNLGFLFKQQGDLKQARFYWQEALRISPSDIFVRQALKELNDAASE